MLKNLLTFETDKQFIALCTILILFGIIANTVIIAPSIIHNSQLPHYTGVNF